MMMIKYERNECVPPGGELKLNFISNIRADLSGKFTTTPDSDIQWTFPVSHCGHWACIFAGVVLYFGRNVGIFNSNLCLI